MSVCGVCVFSLLASPAPASRPIDVQTSASKRGEIEAPRKGACALFLVGIARTIRLTNEKTSAFRRRKNTPSLFEPHGWERGCDSHSFVGFNRP